MDGVMAEEYLFSNPLISFFCCSSSFVLFASKSFWLFTFTYREPFATAARPDFHD
jgi:hypothetical protein